jgi:hypothetical protein
MKLGRSSQATNSVLHVEPLRMKLWRSSQATNSVLRMGREDMWHPRPWQQRVSEFHVERPGMEQRCSRR